MIEIIIGAILLIMIALVLVRILKDEKQEKAIKQAKFERMKLDKQFSEDMRKIANMYALNESQFNLGLSTQEQFYKLGQSIKKMKEDIQEKYQKERNGL